MTSVDDAEPGDGVGARCGDRPGEGVAARRGDGLLAARLAAVKAGRRVAVVLPALDEESTIGPLVEGLRPLTTGAQPLVDDLLVVDSGCTDATAEVAAAAGARVLTREQALPGVAVLPGKGEAMWRAVVALGAGDDVAPPAPPDLICFVDADLVDPHPDLVPRLLAPLLTRSGTALVKGFHRRPLDGDEGHEGGRVTELLARPLLAALAPGLRHVRQPIGGEYAATRELLDRLPFATGYGVDIGLLLDTAAARGTGAIAQADLGVRRHRNRPLHELARTAREVLATALDRCGVPDSGTGTIGYLPIGPAVVAGPDTAAGLGMTAGPGAATEPGAAAGPDAPTDGPGVPSTPGWRTEVHPLAQVDRPPPGRVRAGGSAGPVRPGARRSGVGTVVGGS